MSLLLGVHGHGNVTGMHTCSGLGVSYMYTHTPVGAPQDAP